MSMVFMASPARAELRELKLPKLERFETAQGLKVFVAERQPIPLVAIRLTVRAGSAADPAGKFGLADFVARLMRRGTKKLSVDQIDEAVEFVGGSLAIGVSEDYLAASISAPSEHLEAMLEVLGQVTREPTFPDAEVESARKRVLAQIANDLDDPSVIADRAFGRFMWGDHPYGHDLVGVPKDIRTFTRKDLVQFHQERFGPKVSSLTVVGAVELPRVKAAVEKAFGGWTGGPEEAPKVSAVTKIAFPGTVVVIDKPDQTQAQVRIGGIGFPKGHPDFFPAAVMNTVLGGGFTSRLVNEIRVNRGLSYGAGSFFDTIGAGGVFAVSTFTKNESVKEIIEVALSTVEKLRRQGVSAKELASAKRYMSGLFPLRVETNEAVAGAISDVQLYGLGEAWVEQYRERLVAVTSKQISEVAKKYLFPEAPTLVLVGRASEIVPQVKGFGKVKVLKVSELE